MPRYSKVIRKCSLFAPPPNLTVSQWADKYRFISASNAVPGRWRTELAPYQKEIMDSVTNIGHSFSQGQNLAY